MMKKLLSCMLLLVLLVSLLTSTGFSEDAGTADEVEENRGIVEIVDLSDLPELNGEEISEGFVPEELEKTIIDIDDRITVTNPSSHPFSCIALMDIHYRNCNCKGTATGFMISKNILLTAAHCVVCSEHGNWADTIDFYFGYKGRNNYLYKYSSKWHAWAGTTFQDKTNENDNDYAVVKLYSNVGDKTGWFGYIFGASDDELAKTYLWYVAGYRAGKLKYGFGSVSPLDSGHLFYNIDTEPGNSGGPVFKKENGHYYVVGIHFAGSDECNYAYRLDAHVKNLFDTANDYKK